MDETVGFLRDIYKRQPEQMISTSPGFTDSSAVQVETKDACTLEVTSKVLTADFQLNPGTKIQMWRTLVDLRLSDPLSISTETTTLNATNVTQQSHFVQVELKRAIATSFQLPLPFDPNQSVQELPSTDFSLEGFVLSTANNQILLVGQDAKRYRMPTALPNSSFYSHGQKSGADDIRTGDLLEIKGEKPSKKGMSYTVFFLQLPKPAFGEQYVDYKFPPVPEEETAQRIAKALVHAMVLCHKDEKPSPF